MIADFIVVPPGGVAAKQLTGQYGEVVFATRAGAPGGIPYAIKAQGFCGEKKDIGGSVRLRRAQKAALASGRPWYYSVDHQHRIYREVVLLRYLCSPYFGRAPHPNIVYLHTVRAHLPPERNKDGGVCLVMENGGTTLSSLLRATAETAFPPGAVIRRVTEERVALPLREVRDLCWQLLQGLLYVRVPRAFACPVPHPSSLAL